MAAYSVAAVFGGSAGVIAAKYGGAITKVTAKMALNGSEKAASRVNKVFGLTDEVLSSADDVAKQADEVVEAADEVVEAAAKESGDQVGKSFNKISDSLLKKSGIDAHQLKKDFLGNKAQISRYDLYKDTQTGEILILQKGGKGDPIRTGEFLD
jgi:hypothetical protein